MKKKNFLILFLFVFLLSACGKSGTKSVEKLNDEIKNSSVQFSLSPKEIETLKKSYKEFTDLDKKVFEEILKKYKYFKEKNHDLTLNFENDILRLKQEISNSKNNNDIDFKKESSKNIKLNEIHLSENSTTYLKDLDLSNTGYIVILKGNGGFAYYEGKNSILKQEIASDVNPKYIRILKTDQSKIILEGKLKAELIKDNINYNDFKFMPMGIFVIGKDLDPGNYKVSTKNDDTKIILLNNEKKNSIKIQSKEDLENLELLDGYSIIIKNTNYVQMNKLN